MSLFKRVHTVKVPPEFLDEGAPAISLRFSQLNAKKLAKASLNDTFASLDKQTAIEARLTEKQLAAVLERQKNPDPETTKRAQERAEEPDDFDDFDNRTLVELAHVEHQVESEWVEFTDEQIDEFLYLDWLAAEIYDVSKPKSAKAREKNS